MTRLIPLATMTLAVLAGCGGAPKAPASPFEPSPQASASSIRHVVLVKLKDPGDAEDLIDSMDRLLAPIPGVSSYWRGSRHAGIRPEVNRDYDVGLVIDFRDDAAYADYVVDTRHVELVQAWMPRATSLVIYDIAAQADPRSRPPMKR